ncbi:MAG: hypothetical protein LBH62_05170 [Nitrososphaerota archaeon]|nr:hypothetical protein [Nitrososphaerota archaeon]
MLGHWGTCPGVNTVYAHVSDLIRRTNRPIKLVVGSGHAGSAFLSCTYLDGSLGHYYPSLQYGTDGIKALFKAYATKSGFSTEIQSNFPGALYVGGELGGALAFAQGYSLQNAQSFMVCLIGDGELETSIAQATWQGFSFLSKEHDGKVLPVINANGFKMGSKSLFALMSRTEKEGYLRGHGLMPYFVGTDHHEIAGAFSSAYTQLVSHSCCSQPVIVLETPKGWTAPKNFKDVSFEGSYLAHKPILKNPSSNIDELRMMEEWLSSYNPNELFDKAGNPKQKVTRCLPVESLRLGYTHNRTVKETRQLLHSSKYAGVSKVEGIAEYLCKISNIQDIAIFSPDELDSNRFSKLIRYHCLKYGDRNDDVYSSRSPIIEVLNEHLCFAWAQGYSKTGKSPIIISYEAFATIFASMAEQFLKQQTVIGALEWQPNCPSLNIILTSLGWFNTPTHHSPSFVDGFIGRSLSNINVYMPIFVESSIKIVQKMLNSSNQLNIMVLNKQQFSNLDNVFCVSEERNKAWTCLYRDNPDSADTILVTIGDSMAEQALIAKDIIHNTNPRFAVTILAIEDLSLLESSGHADFESFKQILNNASGTIWIYNGYPKTIKSCLWDLGFIKDVVVLGYLDKDQTLSGEDRFTANNISPICIAQEALRTSNKLSMGFST